MLGGGGGGWGVLETEDFYDVGGEKFGNWEFPCSICAGVGGREGGAGLGLGVGGVVKGFRKRGLWMGWRGCG